MTPRGAFRETLSRLYHRITGQEAAALRYQRDAHAEEAGRERKRRMEAERERDAASQEMRDALRAASAWERDWEEAVVRAARWKRLAKHLRFALAGAEQDTAHLRRGAVAMLAALSDERTDVKPSSLGAALVVWAEYVRDAIGDHDAVTALLRRLVAARDEHALANAAEWLRTRGATEQEGSRGGLAWMPGEATLESEE